MARTACAAVALLVVFAPGVRAQSSGLDLVGMLDTYYQGRYDEAVAKAAALPDLGSVPPAFRAGFAGVGQRGSGAHRSPQRRAAAFLLEVTAARLESDWGRLSDLIEWTCVQLRTTARRPSSSGRGMPPRTRWPDARERVSGCLALRAAAASEAGDAIAPMKRERAAAAPTHLMHALERFPDDPQFQLSRVVAWTWGRDSEPIRNVRRRDDDDRAARRRGRRNSRRW